LADLVDTKIKVVRGGDLGFKPPKGKQRVKSKEKGAR